MCVTLAVALGKHPTYRQWELLKGKYPDRDREMGLEFPKE